MKFQSLKLVFVIVALALTVVSSSSCNRGSGCPYELKTTSAIIHIR